MSTQLTGPLGLLDTKHGLAARPNPRWEMDKRRDIIESGCDFLHFYHVSNMVCRVQKSALHSPTSHVTHVFVHLTLLDDALNVMASSCFTRAPVTPHILITSGALIIPNHAQGLHLLVFIARIPLCIESFVVAVS